MSKLVLALIRFYQRYLSPHKGFRCAHAVYYGTDSCSAAISKMIQRKGVFSSYSGVQNQFERCRHAHQRLQNGDSSRNRKRRKNNDSSCVTDMGCNSLDCVPSDACSGSSDSSCHCL
ncbi:membrane protein insertion efficiency factor YidD [Vibrio owensii]|uniref:membrane protein insertion efficiency factor YidD n=1 Tax=Vibrio owensii TaxID=696485 RepID=UPI0009B8563D|nr:membrane protein insertion efficiency factor YidD [Vibrio owensii]